MKAIASLHPHLTVEHSTSIALTCNLLNLPDDIFFSDLGLRCADSAVADTFQGSYMLQDEPL